jgi:REP-associated tyrosine transposase
MAHTYTNLLNHIIFSTKDRIPYLHHDRRCDVFAYLGGIARQIRVSALNIGGHDDHVHILARIPASISLAVAVNKMKTNSSRWIHEERVLHRAFAWQEGYAAFSVSESAFQEVSSYISFQDEHHQKISFQEELVAFLKRNKVEYDPRYIWS